MDSGCEISSHTSVRCGFIRNVLAHVFQEEGPFLDPAFPLRRWGAEPPEEHHRDHSENPAVAWVVFVVSIVQADLWRDRREVVFGYVISSSSFIIRVRMNYADFALCVLPVAFEDRDLFRVGGDFAAFEEDQRMCVAASLL